MREKGKTMNDYIERDVAIDAFCSLADALNSAKGEHPYTLLEKTVISGKISGIYLCRGIIRTTKSADVEPVRHGRWMKTGAYPHRVYCSVCSGTYAQAHWEVWKDGSLARAYCPNCGAKMDGEDE